MRAWASDRHVQRSACWRSSQIAPSSPRATLNGCRSENGIQRNPCRWISAATCASTRNCGRRQQRLRVRPALLSRSWSSGGGRRVARFSTARPEFDAKEDKLTFLRAPASDVSWRRQADANCLNGEQLGCAPSRSSINQKCKLQIKRTRCLRTVSLGIKAARDQWVYDQHGP